MDRKIRDFDEEEGKDGKLHRKYYLTNETDHIVIHDTMAEEYLDFSTVLGNVEVLRWEFLDGLNRKEDKNLMDLLNKIK